MDRNYEDLANAIVLQAVKDYREALKILVKHPRNLEAKVNKTELELFFYSDWYRTLTNIDPELLVKRLKEEVHNAG